MEVGVLWVFCLGVLGFFCHLFFLCGVQHSFVKVCIFHVHVS